MGFLRWNKPISPARIVPPIVFCLILALAGYLRFSGLGGQSLWVDEFCTWKVAEMPVAESLLWQPELTKPPLYQFAARGISRLFANRNESEVRRDAHYKSFSGVQEFKGSRVPSEWHLRLPAAVCGLLAVAAIWWLGTIAGGWMIGVSAALLFAVNALQIDYSQMARPYSMLVLGSIVSTALWYRLNGAVQSSKYKAQKWYILWLAISYILVTAITFHANYLMTLTVAAHALWWAARFVTIENRNSKIDNLQIPGVPFLGTAILCVPITWHFLRHRTSVFQGLDWIAAPTVSSAIKVLGEITFGPIWIVGLGAAAVVWILRCLRKVNGGTDTSPHHHITTSPNSDLFWLLAVWLAVAWGGLLLISWLAHPAMVARYALPAAAPAILLPLIALQRLDRRLPLLIAGLFAVGTAPVWATRAERVKPGFREMVQFLDDYADPQHEAVVLAIERTTSPGWEEMDLLGFEYYQSSKFEIRSSKNTESNSTSPHRHIATSQRSPIEVLYLRNGRPDGDQPILRDPRALWMVTFLADPISAIESAGRRVEQIEIGDKVLDQLFFEPYRLIRIAKRE